MSRLLDHYAWTKRAWDAKTPKYLLVIVEDISGICLAGACGCVYGGCYRRDAAALVRTRPWKCHVGERHGQAFSKNRVLQLVAESLGTPRRCAGVHSAWSNRMVEHMMRELLIVRTFKALVNEGRLLLT